MKVYSKKKPRVCSLPDSGDVLAVMLDNLAGRVLDGDEFNASRTGRTAEASCDNTLSDALSQIDVTNGILQTHHTSANCHASRADVKRQL